MRVQIVTALLLLTAVAAGSAQSGFGGGGLGGGGYVLRERMKRDRPVDFKLLEKVKSSEIIVVRGTYDHVETVLNYVKVPHIVIDPQDLSRAELNAGQLLLINCPGNVDDAAIARIRKFVRAGGFLFTTDWSLQNVLEKAFPGFVEFTRKPTRDDVVEVRILKKDNHFLQHVQSSKDAPKWWLEGSSYPIRVLDKSRVEVLMASEELERKYGESPVAIHFHYGDGQVLHIISHYYLQRTETRTAFEKGKGTDFANELGVKLTPEAAKALSGTTAGEARDAYSASQLSANIIVAKQKQNAELARLYNRMAKTDGSLRASPAITSVVITPVKQGVALKVLEKRADWIKVQTYAGDVGWLEKVRIGGRNESNRPPTKR